MTTLDRSVYPEIIAKRKEGWPLRRLGKEFGVSGERIRQILLAEGFSETAEVVAAARAEAAQKRLEAARVRLARGEVVGDISRKTRAAARALLTDEEWLEAEFIRRARRDERSLTDEEWEDRRAAALTSLRDAAEQFGSDALSLSQYHRYRVANGTPSEQWIMRMFGSWTDALTAAGLQSRRAVRKYPRISDGDLLAAVEDFVNASIPDRVPLSADNYGIWAKKEERPSRETVLARFGQWREVLRLVKMRRNLNGDDT